MAFQERHQQTHSRLNALVYPVWEQVLQAAHALDRRYRAGDPFGPLAAVPISVKDCFTMRGTPATLGLKARLNELATDDCPLVARLRAQDALLLGKTNVPQLMLMHETDNAVYGRTNHPTHLDRSPGGSSGGEAALIASHGSALGLGNDLGGSIRQPAHACGIVGFKPTTGTLDRAGVEHNYRGLTCLTAEPGPLARSMQDLNFFWQQLHSANIHAPAHLKLENLRVAYWLDDGWFPWSPAIRRAIEFAAQNLTNAGAIVQRWQPPQFERGMEIYFSLLSADGGQTMRGLLGDETPDSRIALLLRLASLPRPLRWLIEHWQQHYGSPLAAKLLRVTGRRSTADFWRLQAELAAWQQQFWQAWQNTECHVWLMAPHALPALTHGACERLAIAGATCYLANLLDCPAGVVPVTHITEEEESDRATTDRLQLLASEVEKQSQGLPVGVQVCGAQGADHCVMQVMTWLEELLAKD